MLRIWSATKSRAPSSSRLLFLYLAINKDIVSDFLELYNHQICHYLIGNKQSFFR